MCVDISINMEKEEKKLCGTLYSLIPFPPQNPLFTVALAHLVTPYSPWTGPPHNTLLTVDLS